MFWSSKAEDLLTNLDSSKTLTEQLSPAAFTLQNSPIWQDSSTTRECREIEEAVGGPQALADLTGSRAYERFTGTQIRKARQKLSISRLSDPKAKITASDTFSFTRFVVLIRVYTTQLPGSH